ncbi:MAG: glycosyltransferase family 39 protein [Alphaproteobacteria bacterium]|nr:glycosyltransferase family 39 protein [Alphaproteobacteria bacterium]
MKIKDITLNTKFLYTILAIAVYTILTICYLRQVNVDEREHLYSSFMVYRGELPYRDFFQHHHPLIWYLFAPFLIFFNNTPYIWYVMRTFNIVFLFLSSYYISKITYDITKNKSTSIITSIIYFGFINIQTSGVEFRPDNLMMLFFISGLYYLLLYLNNNSPSKLLTSYILFLLSFLSLQKIIPLLFGVFIIILCHIKNNPKKTNEILSYLIFPSTLFLTFIAYLYYNDALKDYFELCYLLNTKIKVTYSIVPISNYIVPIISVIFSLYNLKTSSSSSLKIISFLYILQFIVTIIHSPYPQYLLMLYPFISILLSNFLYNLKKPLLTLATIIFVLYQYLYILHFFINYNGLSLKGYIDLSKAVITYSSPSDIIINDQLHVGGLRKSAYGYYWYGHDALSLLDYRIFKRHPWPNLMQIIHQKRPKLIANSAQRICLNNQNEIIKDCFSLSKPTLDDLPSNYIESELMFLRID